MTIHNPDAHFMAAVNLGVGVAAATVSWLTTATQWVSLISGVIAGISGIAAAIYYGLGILEKTKKWKR